MCHEANNLIKNIGLQAKILSTRTFTIFVVMALVTTFLTTPLTVALYPTWYQIKVERWRRGEIDWNGNPVQTEGRSDSVSALKDQLKTVPVRKLLVYLRLDGLSGICTLAALLSPSGGAALSTSRVHPSKVPKQSEQIVEDAVSFLEEEESTLRVHGFRLMELSDRDSSVMKVSAGDNALWDPVVNTFRAFGEWQDLSIDAGVSVVPEYSYAETIIEMAMQDTADLLVLPWSETGKLADRQNGFMVDVAGRFTNGVYADFAATILDRVHGHVGILIEPIQESRSSAAKSPVLERSQGSLSIQGSTWTRPSLCNRSHHIVFPFFGGEDDRFALRLVLQLIQNVQVTATIIQAGGLQTYSTKLVVETTVSASASIISPAIPSSDHTDLVFFETLRDSIPEDLKNRVVFQQPAAQDIISDPVHLVLALVRGELDQTSNKSGNIVVVGRRSHPSDMSIDSSPGDSVDLETRHALGTVGSVMVQPENKVNGSVLVLQAGVSTSFFSHSR